MAVTKLSNMVIPANFADYIAKSALEKNTFFTSGIAVNNPQLQELLSKGGKTVVMPFIKPLDGDSEIPSEGTAMGIGNVATDNDIARRQLRVKAFGENQLASLLAGTNVMDAIAGGFADYWSTQYNKILLSTCKGVFAKLTSKVVDVSGGTGNAALFKVNDIIDAKFLIGDRHDNITAVAMHSAVYAYLIKQDQIATVPMTEGIGQIQVFKPIGCRIIVDDAMPYDSATKIGSVYLFGAGAFGFVESTQGIVAAEIGRNQLMGMGENYLINRKQFALHPLGVQWIEPANLVSPTNADLETAANWAIVDDPKRVALAQYKFKIA